MEGLEPSVITRVAAAPLRRSGTSSWSVWKESNLLWQSPLVYSQLPDHLDSHGWGDRRASNPLMTRTTTWRRLHFGFGHSTP